MPELRNSGLVCTMDYSGRSLKAQMKDANRQQARFAVIIGEQELQQNLFTLRDMVKSEEYQVTSDDIADRVLS